jgi:hypothetical protein
VNLRIGQVPGLVLADTYWMRVHLELRQSGQLHPCLWDFSAPNDQAVKKERRTVIGDLAIVQDELESDSATRNGAVLVKIMCFWLTLMAAGNDAATVVPGDAKAFTAGGYGKATAPDGTEYYLFVDWPELFQYYMMMVAVSATLLPFQLIELHVWYCKQTNANMSATGNNVSSALMAVMAMAPAAQAANMVLTSKGRSHEPTGNLEVQLKASRTENAKLQQRLQGADGSGGGGGNGPGGGGNGPGGVSGPGGKGGRGGGGGGAFAEYRDKTCGDFTGCGSRSHGLYECERTNRGRRERSPDGRAGDR